MAGSKKQKRSNTEVCEEQENTGASEIVPATESEQEDGNPIRQSIATEHNMMINREEYIQAYKDILNESKHLQMKNNVLHRRLAEYFRKRKLDHVLKPFHGAADLEEKYHQKLLSYEELKEKTAREIDDIHAKISAVEKNILGRLESVDKKFIELQNLERSTGTGLIYSRKGKPIAEKTVSRLITLQARKSEQASTLYLRYIRARNAVAELEAVLRKLETLGPGLYVHQYEQLNIDHQNLKIKIEEREDELIRNRSKCTGHSQILSHIREKMDYTDEAIDCAECDLGESEIKYANSRENLGDVKTARNRLRWLLEVEQKKAGLLTRKDLLRDFQNALEEVVVLRKRKEALKTEIANRQVRGTRKNMNI